MAFRGENQMKSDDFHHFCSLCMESYCRRTPKLLPCFHTFCLPCLEALADRSSSGEPEGSEKEDKKWCSDDETLTAEKEEEEEQQLDGSDEEADRIQKCGGKYKKKIQCPTCRAQVIIPTGGLAALQTNFYVSVDADTGVDLADKGPSLCEMCEEGAQEEAQHFCHNCQQHMCRTCRRLHDRVKGTRDHHVESLSEPSAPKEAGEGKKRCQFHPDQILCFHCCKCDVTICLHCKLTSHEGHDTQDMATAAVQAKGELPGLHARADIQLLDACISRLERDELDLKRQKQEVVQQVGSRYDLLVGWVTRARDEFLEEVAAQEQASLGEIHTKKASASFFKGNISNKKMRASHAIGLGPDVVLVKNELQAALLKDEPFEEHQKLADRREHLTFFNSSAEASVLDLSTVRAYMDMLVDMPADGSDVSSLSFRELALAVTKMEAELQDMKDKPPTTKVSFHATLTANPSYSTNYKVIFNNVLCNEGDGYNCSTGIFTSPAKGTYMFTTTVISSNPGNVSYIALMVNNTQWGTVNCSYSSTVPCWVSLKEGDQVWVQSTSNNTFLGNSTMFSGALLSM